MDYREGREFTQPRVHLIAQLCTSSCRLNNLPEDVLSAKVGHLDEAVLDRMRVLTLDLCGRCKKKLAFKIRLPTLVMLMLQDADELLWKLRSARSPLTLGYTFGQDGG